VTAAAARISPAPSQDRLNISSSQATPAAAAAEGDAVPTFEVCINLTEMFFFVSVCCPVRIK
jgi:hypothetical protein